METDIPNTETKYRLDAESRKLRALESRGGPELSAFERSEDATKGPQGALMRVVSMTRRLTAMATRSFVVGEMATGFDIFAEVGRDWLEEPDNDEAELESLLLAVSDDYESSQDPAQQSSELSLVVVWFFRPVTDSLSADIEACRQAS